jgi:peptide/nickel transport system permease protein
VSLGFDAREALPVLPALGRPVAPRRRMLRAFWRDRTALVGLGIVVAFVLVALLAPLVAHRDPNAIDVARKLTPPSRQFPLGSDALGRDVASRLIFGARLSITMAVVASLAIAAIGLLMGLCAGYIGGIVDAVISRVIDVVLTVPGFLLALAVLGTLGPGLDKMIGAVVAVSWASFARVVRSAVLAERSKPYVASARAAGASHVRIVGRHVLPNVISPVVVLTTLEMGSILLGISGLSFLGLGVDPPTAEWGAMLSEARTYLADAPFLMVAPGLAILLMVLGFNLLGDGLRDVLDPRLEDSGRTKRS